MCCGAKMFWCPQAREFECPDHDGFTVCCRNPESHMTMHEVELMLRAILSVGEG